MSQLHVQGRLTCSLELDHGENDKEVLIGCGLCRREQGLDAIRTSFI